ncbi:hypothetical protein HAX54_017269 [Datura stramonium]|uniref:Uncharacterized protein n=1 Tax=Datura stramonium TaxID=4076 RepID=A0ABS8ULN8_DATST|nr:hypothetical protein [Datura stramonium]
MSRKKRETMVRRRKGEKRKTAGRGGRTSDCFVSISPENKWNGEERLVSSGRENGAGWLVSILVVWGWQSKGEMERSGGCICCFLMVVAGGVLVGEDGEGEERVCCAREIMVGAETVRKWRNKGEK